MCSVERRRAAESKISNPSERGIYLFVTMLTPIALMLCASYADMKIHVWDNEIGCQFRPVSPRPTRSKRKTVAQILRAAYRQHVRDPHTRRAVKRCLR